ncbi:5'-nucleotidase domain-containing protein 1 [Microtus ochrogaster]|uniref:5'-nucleotidase domain-containing protein 1 n=1 Tax=Microtus ochrogaster TaxID=79684 RepID=A0A8J6KTI5_MICOH|nr:5'-nucleotidase domain-containing protein 1 [Microtus ochrogaster]
MAPESESPHSQLIADCRALIRTPLLGYYSKEKNDEEQEELPSLDKPGWYSQGNAAHLYELLKKMTGKPEPKVVYFGDSMHSDIFPAHHYSNWETVLILEELRGQDMEKAEEAEPLEKRGKYEAPKVKPLYSLSNKWGSYFIDSVSRRGNAEDSLVYTWSSRRISTYSTIAIPSIETIAGPCDSTLVLKLGYRFELLIPGLELIAPMHMSSLTGWIRGRKKVFT